ncbi:hypothetical protein D3C72_1702790 [compost metagenome]
MFALQARVAAQPVPDRDVHAVAREIRQGIAGDDLQIDVGVARVKVVQARNQPGRCEESGGADGKHAACRRRRDAGRGVQYLAKRIADGRQVVPAGIGQQDAAVHAHEERHAQVLLQRLDQLADRARRDAQLLRRRLHGLMAGGGIEGAQGIERRESGWEHGRRRGKD